MYKNETKMAQRTTHVYPHEESGTTRARTRATYAVRALSPIGSIGRPPSESIQSEILPGISEHGDVEERPKTTFICKFTCPWGRNFAYGLGFRALQQIAVFAYTMHFGSVVQPCLWYPAHETCGGGGANVALFVFFAPDMLATPHTTRRPSPCPKKQNINRTTNTVHTTEIRPRRAWMRPRARD
jgi:hypothetical protein